MSPPTFSNHYPIKYLKIQTHASNAGQKKSNNRGGLQLLDIITAPEETV